MLLKFRQWVHGFTWWTVVNSRAQDGRLASTSHAIEEVKSVKGSPMWPRVARGIAVTAGALLLVVFSSTVWGNANMSRSVEAAPWRGPAAPIPKGPHVFSLSIAASYCAGEQPPKVDHIEVSERQARRSKPFKSAVITAYLRLPTPRDLGASDPGEVQPCADIGFRLRRVIKLERPVRDLILFDGSYSPPRRVWPPAR